MQTVGQEAPPSTPGLWTEADRMFETTASLPLAGVGDELDRDVEGVKLLMTELNSDAGSPRRKNHRTSSFRTAAARCHELTLLSLDLWELSV